MELASQGERAGERFLPSPRSAQQLRHSREPQMLHPTPWQPSAEAFLHTTGMPACSAQQHWTLLPCGERKSSLAFLACLSLIREAPIRVRGKNSFFHMRGQTQCYMPRPNKGRAHGTCHLCSLCISESTSCGASASPHALPPGNSLCYHSTHPITRQPHHS